MIKTAEVEIVQQGENKFEYKVNGVKVAVFFKYENAVQYEKDLKELNPYMRFFDKVSREYI